LPGEWVEAGPVRFGNPSFLLPQDQDAAVRPAKDCCWAFAKSGPRPTGVQGTEPKIAARPQGYRRPRGGGGVVAHGYDEDPPFLMISEVVNEIRSSVALILCFSCTTAAGARRMAAAPYGSPVLPTTIRARRLRVLATYGGVAGVLPAEAMP
jgi:hypothetical protein